MAKCVICENEVNGFYDYKGVKKPICFEHYEDGTFVNYLTAQQSEVRTAEPLCQVCLMPLSQHVHECVVPSTRR